MKALIKTIIGIILFGISFGIGFTSFFFSYFYSNLLFIVSGFIYIGISTLIYKWLNNKFSFKSKSSLLFYK